MSTKYTERTYIGPNKYYYFFDISYIGNIIFKGRYIKFDSVLITALSTDVKRHGRQK